MRNMRKIALGASVAPAALVCAGPEPQPRADLTDPAKAVQAIQKAWADFQAENDNRIAEAVRNGVADVITEDKVNRINAAITDIQDVIDQQAKTIGRLTVGGGAGDEAKQRKAAATMFSVVKNKRIKPADADLEAYRSYVDAFADMIVAGGPRNLHHLPGDIQAALSVGSDRDGGYFVPTEMSMELERRIFETSPMRQIARVVSINSGAWEAPYKSADATSGGWVGERQSRSSTATPTVGMQRIEVHEQYAYPEVTQTMLDDAAIDVESFLTDETEDKMSRTENTAYVSGSGVLQPKGFTTYKSDAVTTDDASRAWGVLQYVVSGASGGFATLSGIPGAADADPLITLISKLNPAYRPNARFVMNRSVEATIRKLKDGDGRYLVGFGDLRDNALGFSLLGFPITNLEDMADLASDSFSLAFGDFRRGYYIIDRIGFRVLMDPYTNKPYVGFYITKRTGGDVRNFDAIKLMKFGTS